MALPPELSSLKKRLEDIGYAKRTATQDKLLAELVFIDDDKTLQKSIRESHYASDSVTRMTSPGAGPCNCCGR